MDWMQAWELSSYVVTTLGLPLAVIIFVYQEQRERNNEEEEAYQMLSDAYIDFLKVVLDNADLPLREPHSGRALDDEQRRRMQTIHEMLVSLFERAYLVAWTEDTEGAAARRWASWDDYMRDWLSRDAFSAELESLLRGEDAAFRRHMLRLAEEVRRPTPGTVSA
ncbi:MAG: hypothetical protein KKD25_17525 [Gammaproteobacteria bacterium]|jgi:hypothetical protein|nr:hypothetical protein [Gammaproteobacteria bacterium]MBU0770732.1 hypothetical protein [Gammaproteobacteria bacterium]MBU0857606.1 hypothetical protein [Gammaproteobacteria bacterium]MBU1848650.1 hypothetical protein [Gammaproteobacteria bacterium]